MKSKSFSDRFLYIAILVGMLLAAVSSLFPIFNLLATSLSNQGPAEANMVTIYPIGFNLDSYQKILEDKQFFTAALISIERLVLGCSIQLIVTCLSAFALSRRPKDFRMRSVYMWFVVSNMLFSGGLIPMYINIRNLGLINKIWALVLPNAVPVFSIIILTNFFRNIPKEMDESSMIDGAGPWTTFLQIYLPLSMPSLATITLFSLVFHWNSFFDGLILMNRSNRYPLATYIQTIIVEQMSTNMTLEEQMYMRVISTKTINAAKVFVTMIPILAMYPFLQRYFIHGIMLGSIKE